MVQWGGLSPLCTGRPMAQWGGLSSRCTGRPMAQWGGLSSRCTGRPHGSVGWFVSPLHWSSPGSVGWFVSPCAPRLTTDQSWRDPAHSLALASLLRRTILGLKSAGNFLLEFMASVLIALTVKLNNVSADYRYIAKKLSKQKRHLKV